MFFHFPSNPKMKKKIDVPVHVVIGKCSFITVEGGAECHDGAPWILMSDRLVLPAISVINSGTSPPYQLSQSADGTTLDNFTYFPHN